MMKLNSGSSFVLVYLIRVGAKDRMIHPLLPSYLKNVEHETGLGARPRIEHIV